MIKYSRQLQVAVRRLPSVSFLCFYGFNLTSHFMVGSKGVNSSSENIMGWINLRTVFKLNQTGQPTSEDAQLLASPLLEMGLSRHYSAFNCSNDGEEFCTLRIN